MGVTVGIQERSTGKDDVAYYSFHISTGRIILQVRFWDVKASVTVIVWHLGIQKA